MLAAILAQVTFTMVPLEAPSEAVPLSLNNNGEACGYLTDGYNVSACRWDSEGHLELLGRAVGFGDSVAASINDSGVVAGHATHGFPYTSIPLLWLSDGYSPQHLPTGAWATAVTNRGDLILGYYTESILLPREGGRFSISGYVSGLNDRGQACGFDSGFAFRWDRGSLLTLLPAPGFDTSMADDITASGSVVALSRVGTVEHATAWDVAGIPQLLPSTKLYSSAQAVNDNGWVVGYEYDFDSKDLENVPAPRAVLWVNGIYQSLPLSQALDVNEGGQIVGILGGKAFRLDPL